MTAAAVVSLSESNLVASLADNDFVLFGLSEQFAQDLNLLADKWKALQREAHPDKFAAQGASAQRLAMQWSVRINEGYERLKDPLKRAAYLCELQGAPVQAENNTAMPAAFLMQQMEWRENLDDTESAAGLAALADEVSAEQRRVQQELARLLDEVQDPLQAVGQVRALMFIERFTQEVNAKLDRLT